MSEFVRAKVEIDETAATIAADRRYLEAGVEAIKSARSQIERKIRKDRFFLTTLEPYEPAEDDGPTVRRMCEASGRAGVGPMASVAGAIAQTAMEAMAAQGCEYGWVDNGGDIALNLAEPVTLEVFTNPSSGKALALELGKTEGILGLCSSSGKLGHSISFGNADIALVIAEDAFLADAFATALGNKVMGPESLESCFEAVRGVRGIIGALVLLEGAASMYGKVPKLTETEHNPERMTIHSSMASPRFLGTHGWNAGAKT